MNYTKGEWEVAQDGMVIAKHDDQISTCIADCYSNTMIKKAKNWQANAHLIAKSPRMIELIRKLAIQKFVFFPEDRVEATKIIDSLA